MSFWSWIGLPDKKDIQALQSEIDSLKEENKAYAEMNNQFIRLMGDVSNKCDVISEGLSDNRSQMNALMADTLYGIDALRAEITAIRDGIHFVQSNSSDTEKHIQQLSSDIERINSNVNTINDIDSELKSLTEYVNCLWSATKALWVNDLVSGLDDTINSEREEKPQYTVDNNEKHNVDEYVTAYDTSFDTDSYWAHYSSDVY